MSHRGGGGSGGRGGENGSGQGYVTAFVSYVYGVDGDWVDFEFEIGCVVMKLLRGWCAVLTSVSSLRWRRVP